LTHSVLTSDAFGRNIWEEMAPHMALLDVVGYNYALSRYESDHIKYPDRIMVGTENNPPRAHENWQLVKKLPYADGVYPSDHHPIIVEFSIPVK
jgi:hypothetical protein